jgi:hypothetical protein
MSLENNHSLTSERNQEIAFNSNHPNGYFLMRDKPN